MKSITNLRRRKILEYIQSNQRGEVSYFAQQYKVSEVTIRNDLNRLERKGCLTRCYGGARLNRQFVFERPFGEKKQMQCKIKAKLGEYAASLINNGDKIILDSGSTLEQVALNLDDKNDLVVMTNGINIAYHLANKNNLSLMLTGGFMRSNSYSICGSMGEEFLSEYHFNTFFLGVDGFDKSLGITTPHQAEANINRKMLEAAQNVIAVTDSSKFNRQSFCMIAHPKQLNMLITDSGIPQDYYNELTTQGIDVRIVD
ncbi:DeoR faimly transcriptional regulator [Photobacterium angustum]|uniref:DeoR/GlpR transcriptional regulator n=1 Tax=Photobacterium angustum TaxID=661 RepID=A0ABX5H591_PHOAN|nr:transcriptional repressor AgaR [Photobacterium angustum]KJG36162.1 DeoR faimly transcriptional regulator [Photobacterium angustum]PSX10944.1 DeoR/GlpR transcriptional regulator [Photobacterium angustum]